MPTFDFTAPDGTNHSIEGPEGATREQAFQMLQLKLGGSPAPAAPKEESTTSDIIKSADAGVGKGLSTLIGLPGDVASLAHNIAPQGVIDAVKAVPGAKFLYDHLPGSEAVKASIPSDFSANYNKDADYQPQGVAGRYTKALISNAIPGLATGMGPLAVGAGAIAGQGVEDLTGSKTAGDVTNMAASIATPWAQARRARVAMQALKDVPAVKAEANFAYNDQLLRDTKLDPSAPANLADAMRTELQGARSKFAPAQNQRVYDTIDNLAQAGKPASGIGPTAPISIEDLHSLRKTLGKDARATADFKPTEQAVAAGTAKRVLDQYLDNVPVKDVISGDAQGAVASLRDANANWGAQSNAKKIENLIGNATVDNNAANSGMNLGNRIRQTFKPLLKNDAAQLRGMGYGDDVINAVSQVNKGDFTTNLLRHASNMLGGGGGIGSAIIGHGLYSAGGGVAGYEQGGLPGMIAGSVLGSAPGQLLRLAANKRVLKLANNVQQQVLSKAPANAGIVASNNVAKAANKAVMKRALTRNGIPAAALLLSKFNGR